MMTQQQTRKTANQNQRMCHHSSYYSIIRYFNMSKNQFVALCLFVVSYMLHYYYEWVRVRVKMLVIVTSEQKHNRIMLFVRQWHKRTLSKIRKGMNFMTSKEDCLKLIKGKMTTTQKAITCLLHKLLMALFLKQK